MSIRRRDFILGSLAMPVFAGCGTFGLFGRRPALAFGVISDIHVTTPESTEKFRRALRYFRSRGADAVVVAGDLSDWGLKSGFRYVAEAWKEEMAGTETVPLFCTGNHDYEGWWYGDMTLDMHVQGYSEDEALVKLGMDKVWREVFGEPFSLMRHRKVKGYDFISAEWEEMDKTHSEPRTAQWFREHASELPKDRPFFFFRHEPIPDTVIGFAKKTEENLALKEALKAFHKLPSDESAEQCFLYDAMDMPETGRYRFAVYPRNCFGAKGKPICSRFFETKPGKDKAKGSPI